MKIVGLKRRLKLVKDILHSNVDKYVNILLIFSDNFQVTHIHLTVN
jgi:hypothetical protein